MSGFRSLTIPCPASRVQKWLHRQLRKLAYTGTWSTLINVAFILLATGGTLYLTVAAAEDPEQRTLGWALLAALVVLAILRIGRSLKVAFDTVIVKRRMVRRVLERLQQMHLDTGFRLTFWAVDPVASVIKREGGHFRNDRILIPFARVGPEGSEKGDPDSLTYLPKSSSALASEVWRNAKHFTADGAPIEQIAGALETVPDDEDFDEDPDRMRSYYIHGREEGIEEEVAKRFSPFMAQVRSILAWPFLDSDGHFMGLVTVDSPIPIPLGDHGASEHDGASGHTGDDGVGGPDEGDEDTFVIEARDLREDLLMMQEYAEALGFGGSDWRTA